MKLELEITLTSLAEKNDRNKVQPQRQILQTQVKMAKLKSRTFSGSTSRTAQNLGDLGQRWHLGEE